MKRPVLHHFVCLLLIAVSVCIFGASSAHADTLTLPQQYTYPGLTFSSPLTYTTTASLPKPTTSIAFIHPSKLTITKTTTSKPLESIVLTPTVASETPTPQDTSTQPTPTISLNQTSQESDQVVTTTPSEEPTVPETPTPSSISYTPVPQQNTGGLNASDLFSMVNGYRASQGLPAFQEDAKTCSLAQERAPEIAGEVASGNMHAGLEAMNLPYWNTENIISMNSDQAAFNWWINDPIHHEAIVGNFTYSCVACSGNSCAEEFTSYQPR
jgi:uncharacterized protein YkwD